MPTHPAFPSRLIEGYRSFLDGRMPLERHRFRELARHGQSPTILVIGCCDSRVSPEVIFDAHPGELFVVRNVANLVPPYTSDRLCHGVFAALEFAVLVLRVRHIVVLGHAGCGGIRAYVEQGPALAPGDAIHRWMSMISEAAGHAGLPGQEGYLTQLERAAIAGSLHNLMTFPYVADAVRRGDIALHGAWFEIETGHVLVGTEAGFVEATSLGVQVVA
ncbi:MAG: carbonic anhydrase [Reyranella sp.]|nr:carbonic anhydrase [Reyranella sp.]